MADIAPQTIEQERALALARARLRLKEKAQLLSKPVTAPEPDPDLAHNLKVAGSSLLEGAPRAIGTALGTLGGGAVGSLVAPVAGTIAGGIGGGIAGGAGAEELADLATRYFTGNPEATYRGTVQSKLGAQPTSEGERLAQTMIGAGLDIGTSAGVGSLVKGAGSAAIRKAGQMMAAQPLTQLAAGEAGAATTELADNKAAGLGASLIPAAYAAVKGRVQFPKAAAAKTLDEIKTAATAAYDKAKNAGVVVNQAATTALANKLRTTMTDFGFDEDAHDIIKPIVKMINKRSGQDLSLSQLDTFRRALNTRVKKAFSSDGGADDARIGSAVVQKLDNFINELDNSQLSKGNTRVALPALEEARKLWRQKTKMETVSDILGEAERTGDTKKIERGFTRIAKNENLFNKFSLDEQRIIGKIVKGDALDLIKDAAPGITSSGISKGAVWSLLGYFNPVLAATGAAGSAALKFVTRNSDKNQAEALSELISRGYKPGTFDYGAAIAPSAVAGAREAMQPEPSDSYIDEKGVPHINIRKAVGGLASLKKRYG